MREFVTGLDETDPTALAFGAGCLAVILGLRLISPKLPGVLIAVVGATALVAALGLSDELPIVGAVPSGLPRSAGRTCSLSDATVLLPAAVGIAFVAFADTSVLSRSYAARLHQPVDQNRELAALGAANLAAGRLPGLPGLLQRLAHRRRGGHGRPQPARRPRRRAHARRAAARRHRPRARHAAERPGRGGHRRRARPVRRARRAAAVPRGGGPSSRSASPRSPGVAVLGVLWGVGIAIALSLLNFIRRAWYPHDAVLGRVENLKGYHDTRRYPDARADPRPGAVPLRRPAVLRQRRQLPRTASASSPTPTAPAGWSWPPSRSPTSTPPPGETLAELHTELDAAGRTLAFAELKDPVRDLLRRYGIEAAIGPERFYPTVGVAVAAYLAETGTDWTDWEDRAR